MTGLIFAGLFMLLVFMLLIFMPAANAEVIDMNVTQPGELLSQSASLIDIRTADEWANTGVIAKSIALRLFDKYGGFDGGKWLAEMTGSISQDRPIVLICHAGVRSK